MQTSNRNADRTRRHAEVTRDDVIRFDAAALQAAATRTDRGPDAIVSRAFLRDVLMAVTEPGRIRIVHPGQAPTPLASA